MALPDGQLIPEPPSGRGRRHGTSNQEPLDRWFRYPAGFASDYVSVLLDHLNLPAGSLIVDPFAGSGVTGTAARAAGLSFFGIEAHPLIAELAYLKMIAPPGDPSEFTEVSRVLTAHVHDDYTDADRRELEGEPELVRRCFTEPVLSRLIKLRHLIQNGDAGVWQPYAKWALLGALRDLASARVGWPHQRPGTQRKPPYTNPLLRFRQRAGWIAEDLAGISATVTASGARVVCGDARDAESWAEVSAAQGCVSSPPYLNNFDYADATRLELYFWGEITSWAEMCSTIRADMITATTQQSSVAAARESTTSLQDYPSVSREVAKLVTKLEVERRHRTRGKEYDRVVPDYFNGIARSLLNLSNALAEGAPAIWLVGDSAPYGIYVDTPALIGELAEDLNLTLEKDIVLRRRGNRWMTNATKHNVELSERLLLMRRR